MRFIILDKSCINIEDIATIVWHSVGRNRYQELDPEVDQIIDIRSSDGTLLWTNKVSYQDIHWRVQELVGMLEKSGAHFLGRPK